MPGEPLQSPSQAPQVWEKKNGPPEVMPSQVIPPAEVMLPQVVSYKTRDTGPPSGQPPLRGIGRGGRQKHVVERVGAAPGLGGLKGEVPSQELTLVAPGGEGPRGATPHPPAQGPRSSHAPAGKITNKYGTFRPTFCQMFQQLVVLFLKILVISFELFIHKYSSKHCLFAYYYVLLKLVVSTCSLAVCFCSCERTDSESSTVTAAHSIMIFSVPLLCSHIHSTVF
jgi:hypothetical protein